MQIDHRCMMIRQHIKEDAKNCFERFKIESNSIQFVNIKNFRKIHAKKSSHFLNKPHFLMAMSL